MKHMVKILILITLMTIPSISYAHGTKYREYIFYHGLKDEILYKKKSECNEQNDVCNLTPIGINSLYKISSDFRDFYDNLDCWTTFCINDELEKSKMSFKVDTE